MFNARMFAVVAGPVVAGIFSTAGPLAGDEKKPMGKANEGTITKMASSVKMILVKDSAGKETAIWWNDSTKVAGEKMRQGARVHWQGAEKDGKMWATWIYVGEKKM